VTISSLPEYFARKIFVMSQIPPILQVQQDDIKRMIACSVHLGSENLDQGMQRYVHGRNENGIHIIDIRKTWEKIQLAARVIVAINNPKDVCVVGLTSATSRAAPFSQRAVLKFAKYIGCHAIAARFTPGTFTNQVQPNFLEPRLLIASDPAKDHQPILEASYVNLPVIAFCNTNSNLRNVDIAIPCNTAGKFSIALMYHMLAREVLRLLSKIPRNVDWEVMVDMFIYRDPAEAEKQEEITKNRLALEGQNSSSFQHQQQGDYNAQNGENWQGGNFQPQEGEDEDGGNYNH